MCVDVCGCAWMCVGMCTVLRGYVRVSVSACGYVWNEFSEYLMHYNGDLSPNISRLKYASYTIFFYIHICLLLLKQKFSMNSLPLALNYTLKVPPNLDHLMFPIFVTRQIHYTENEQTMSLGHKYTIFYLQWLATLTYY